MVIGSLIPTVGREVDMPMEGPSRGGNITGRPVFVKSAFAHSCGRSSDSPERTGVATNIRATIASVTSFFTTSNLLRTLQATKAMVTVAIRR